MVIKSANYDHLSAKEGLSLGVSDVQTLAAHGNTILLSAGCAVITTGGAYTDVVLQRPDQANLNSANRSGHVQLVTNASANAVTFAAAANSNVAAGTSSVIAANTTSVFVWVTQNGAAGRWYSNN